MKTVSFFKNCVFFGYSSKSHDGFLGNSVIGEWCNIGANTNNSNLKNNYKKVKVWDYSIRKIREIDQQFCGLFMGDHSKCGIGTMFNTGTIVGVSSNIFGSGFQPKFIPSFTWGKTGAIYELKKAIETATIVMLRRKVSFNSKAIKSRT